MANFRLNSPEFVQQALSRSRPTGDEVINDGNHRQDKQNVNEANAYVKCKKAQKPHQQQNSAYNSKHFPSYRGLLQSLW
jgi:hypothetical protein